jgi:hypothetical protein
MRAMTRAGRCRGDVPDLLTRLHDALNVAHVIAPFSGPRGESPIGGRQASSSRDCDPDARDTTRFAAAWNAASAQSRNGDYHAQRNAPERATTFGQPAASNTSTAAGQSTSAPHVAGYATDTAAAGRESTTAPARGRE